MATFSVLSIRDVVGANYGRPFFAPSVGSGVRSVTHEVNTSADGNMLNTNPDDFEIYSLGSFDDQTCKFDLLDVPELIVRCSALVSKA